jgi:hypothetical protein
MAALRLKGVDTAPEAARIAVDRLRAELPAAVHARLRMLASELVSTAVCCRARTMEPVIELHVERWGETVRLEVIRVAGEGERSHDRLAPDPQWTLAMLDEFADDWGVVHDECGRPVRSWAEVRTAAAAE